MIRTIIKPTKNSLTIRLPDNLVGEMVEVDAGSHKRIVAQRLVVDK